SAARRSRSTGSPTGVRACRPCPPLGAPVAVVDPWVKESSAMVQIWYRFLGFVVFSRGFSLYTQAENPCVDSSTLSLGTADRCNFRWFLRGGRGWGGCTWVSPVPPNSRRSGHRRARAPGERPRGAALSQVRQWAR